MSPGDQTARGLRDLAGGRRDRRVCRSTGSGSPGPSSRASPGGRLARVGLTFEPQSRHRIEFVMKAGAGQTGDVRLSVTPGASPGSPNRTVARLLHGPLRRRLHA
ncbi:hypothetical protein G5V59_21760 [Nocardioides sp. W3-2-3]|uniref:hypothetical protein n=1 Tax=Nocardioides convexus TaxID=2712224 RepID=UPI00241885C5|nr:hypothetical protein [Nocardioides convexus]NHA01540.1 hypothetical protein [Nocardioides convexus]